MSSSLNILAINWRDPLHPQAGGAEIHLDRLLTYLSTNHRVTLVSTRVTRNEVFEYNGYTVHRIGHPFLFNFSFPLLWWTIFKYRKFDLVIDDISKIGLQTPLYIKDIPIVAIFHHLHGKTVYKLFFFPLVSFYVHIMERIALNSYQKTPIVTVSPSSYQELQKIIKCNDIHILPNGIDESLFQTQKVDKVLFQLCSVSRLVYSKRIDLALDVFAKLLTKFPSAVFMIAGVGKEEKRLKMYAKKIKIEHAVRFLGFISEEQKKHLLESSMAMLFTSEKEGWGVAAIEASACGTPVFGFRVPGLIDSVQNGINGYLAMFGDVTALSQQIQQYFCSSQKNIYKLQQQSICFAKNYRWDKITKEFELIVLTYLKS